MGSINYTRAMPRRFTLNFRRAAVVVAVLTVRLSFPPSAFADPVLDEDVLETNTRKAEERIKKWDEEDKKEAKRNRWELPLATALILTGSAFATRNQPYIYGTSFALATGLIFHFWTHRREPPPEPPITP
jgi:hypothetical protein